jgi:hypothetical protein
LSTFIFMLTVDDQTVSNALDVYDQVTPTNVDWVGFKDIGVDTELLRTLVEHIHGNGRTAVLEVVSLDEESETASVAAGLDIGVDVIMGGTHPDAVLPLLEDTEVRYFPFVGVVEGHPSRLVGTIEETAELARQLSARPGVSGLDLLAYRFDGDVEGLLSAVVDASDKPVIAAGSINSLRRIATVNDSGAWGFTIGSAIITDEIFPGLDVAAQVERVLAVTDKGNAEPARTILS